MYIFSGDFLALIMLNETILREIFPLEKFPSIFFVLHVVCVRLSDYILKYFKLFTVPRHFIS